MSNAMRSGKRLLAGVAAGALAAGFMTFVVAPPATAAATDAATVEWDNPSAVLVGEDLTDDTRVSFGFTLIDSSGDETTALTSTQKIEIKLTRPSTVTDDSLAYGFDDTTYANSSDQSGITRSVTGGVTTTIIPTGTNLDDSYGGIGVYVDAASAGAVGSWEQAVDAGRNGMYTATVSLINTATNAVISSDTATFNLATLAGAPAATATWLSGPSFRNGSYSIVPLTRLGQTFRDNMDTTDDTPVIYLTDANGGPYIVKGQANGMIDLSVDAASTSDDSTSGGWNTAVGQGMNSFYSINAALPTWSDVGDVDVTVDVTPSGSTSVGDADLTVEVAGAESPGTVNAVLNNATQYRVSDDNYEVPTGTTSLTFDVTSSTGNIEDTTLAWNIYANALDDAFETGIASPTGGATVQKVDEGSVTIAIADGNDAGDAWTFRSGVGTSGTTDDTVTVTFADPLATLDATPPIGKVGDAVAVPGTITDQFGNALLGTWAMTLKATSNCSATSVATATAAADGSFTFEIPASQSPTSASTKTFYGCGTNGFTDVDGQPVAIPVVYTTSGGVGSLTLAPSTTISGVTTTIRPLTQIPGNGTASLGTPTSTTWNPATADVVDDSASVTAAQNTLRLVATTDINASVTFTGTEGVLFTTRTAGSIAYTDASSSYTSPGTATTATVSVFATKPGLHTVTATAGSTTKTYNFFAEVSANSGRVLSVEPTSLEMLKNEFKSLTYSVKDIYGNRVPANLITVALAGGGSVSGAATTTVRTDDEGKGVVFYTAPDGFGTALITAAGATSQWVTTAVSGAPASVRTVQTTVRVSEASTKTITIVGERGTVRGKPGIIIEGATTGFESGATVKPWIRFPGQSSYEAGSARPTVSAVGDFSWQRKTGKKIYVYFTNDDDSVKSNRVIIQAK